MRVTQSIRPSATPMQFIAVLIRLLCAIYTEADTSGISLPP
ncbi:MAG: hypothetical protein JWQ49_6027 [Edaphobacter sp.]|nr:hypothetical protein [Edaphobacter sp.]